MYLRIGCGGALQCEPLHSSVGKQEGEEDVQEGEQEEGELKQEEPHDSVEIQIPSLESSHGGDKIFHRHWQIHMVTHHW